MIPKLRDQAIVRLGAGIAVLSLAPMLAAALVETPFRKLGAAVGVIAGILGLLIYLFGLVDFAKSKGYESVIVVAVLGVCVLCLNLASIFLVTPVVLFVLKDKTPRYWQRSSKNSLATASQIVGWFLSFAGGAMVLGFVILESFRLSRPETPSARPFWTGTLTVIEVGLLPLFAGVQFLREGFEVLRKWMRSVFVVYVVMLVNSVILHLFWGDLAASQLGFLAATGLVGGVISGAFWVTARIFARKTVQRRQGDSKLVDFNRNMEARR